MKLIIESGVAGADRISRDDLNRVTKEYIQKVLSKYDKFIDYKISGSVNVKSKKDFGDIDLIIHIEGENKKDAKQDLVNFFLTFPESILGKFKNPKYLNKRTYNAGELVSIRFIYDNGKKSVQIDNIVSLSEVETEFKKRFLDFPAEKQGLVLGLVKITFLEETSNSIFNRIGYKPKEKLKTNQEWEFNLSSSGLTLRIVTLDNNYKELNRKDIWKTDNWSYVEKLLAPYDLSLSFHDLYDEVKNKIKNPRSKFRLVGLFKSMVTVKSGEEGTEKGITKLQNIEKMSKLLQLEFHHIKLKDLL